MFCRTRCLPNPFDSTQLTSSTRGHRPAVDSAAVESTAALSTAHVLTTTTGAGAAGDLTVKYCIQRKTQKFGCRACVQSTSVFCQKRTRP